jgi:hypothetical protein
VQASRRKISRSRFQWLILNGILPDGRAAAVIGYDGDFRCRHFSDNGRRRNGASPSPIAISAPWTCAGPGRGRACRAGPASHQMVVLGLCQYATIAEPAAFRRIVAAEILAESEHEAARFRTAVRKSRCQNRLRRVHADEQRETKRRSAPADRLEEHQADRSAVERASRKRTEAGRAPA